MRSAPPLASDAMADVLVRDRRRPSLCFTGLGLTRPHGAVYSDGLGKWVNSRAFTKRYKASQRKSKAARKARRAGRS